MKERQPDQPTPNNQEGSVKKVVHEVLTQRSRRRGAILLGAGLIMFIGGKLAGEEASAAGGAAASVFGASELFLGRTNPPQE